ncbi:MAG: hypothetical protein QXH12_04415 [Candidatus Caldarchaeum sp.]
MKIGRVLLFLVGVLLAAVGVALSWRLLVELVGLLLVVVGLSLAVSALFRGKS